MAAVLIAWFYEHTQSVALAQLIHISSTGALVVLTPPAVTPAQEATWYVLYAALLWAARGASLATGVGYSGRKFAAENVTPSAQAPAREAVVPVFAAIMST